MSSLASQNLNMIFKTPRGETVHALKDLNFTIKKGELLTVLGPSGCGKTTLLNITAGFIRPTSGKITLNNKKFILQPNETIFIPVKSIHRIENPYKKPVKIIEAQLGSILKETDIVRYQDIYGRVK